MPPCPFGAVHFHGAMIRRQVAKRTGAAAPVGARGAAALLAAAGEEVDGALQAHHAQKTSASTCC